MINKNGFNRLKKYLPAIPMHLGFIWVGTFGQKKTNYHTLVYTYGFKNSYFVLSFGGNGITFSVAGMEEVSYQPKGKKPSLNQIVSIRKVTSQVIYHLGNGLTLSFCKITSG